MQIHDPHRRDFASDNYAGIHPHVLDAMVEANGGHVHGYGDDPYTDRLADVVREQFGAAAQVYPVVTGTGANVVALTAMVPRWGCVVTATTAHLHTDEAGAPERLSGLKLITVEAEDGRLTPEALRSVTVDPDVHVPQPSVVSIAQATELGTVYSLDQIGALADEAHRSGLRVYMDGARLANAAAALGTSLGAVAAGVDVVTLGGTKNGCYDAEAIVVLDPGAVDGLGYVRKMTAQLASKARFTSAQLVALYGGDLWSQLAGRSNTMARRLAAGLSTVPGIDVVRPVQANAVFVTMPAATAERLRERWAFYDWYDGTVRLMCAWDTEEQDVDAFVAAASAT